jgi:hypothetical protein
MVIEMNFKQNWDKWLFGGIALSLLWLLFFELVTIQEFMGLIGTSILINKYLKDAK